MTTKSLSTYVISITPFDKNLAVDEAAYRGHLDRMAEALSARNLRKTAAPDNPQDQLS